MERVVKPELLDELPADDPRARASRQDLQWVNSLMGHNRVFTGWLRSVHRKGAGPLSRLVELGAGDGRVLLHVLRQAQPACRPAAVWLVDRHDLVPTITRAGYEELGVEVKVIVAEAVDWLLREPVLPRTGIMANLFLHHFPPAQLRALLAAIAAHAQWFAACEPRRGKLAMAGCQMLRLAGCHSVTVHDGLISVRAGFKGKELSSYWPGDAWRCQEWNSGPFSHCFTAERLSQPPLGR